MINSNPPPRLVKHIIRSYARLAENSRVRAILRENLPATIKDKTFYQNLDESSKRWLQNLMKQLSNTNMPIMNNMMNNIPMQVINPINEFGFNFNDNFEKGIGMGYNVKQNYQVNGFMYKNGK